MNEYIPGHGISAHVDAPKVFDDTITSVSLGSTCVMEFVHKETKEKHNVILHRRSCVVLTKDARYKYVSTATIKL